MRYVLIDQVGASRGHFVAFSDLLLAIDEIRNDDEDLVAEFCVVKYNDEGARVDDPIEAAHLVPLAAEAVAAITVSTTGEASAYDQWQARSSDLLQTA